MVQLDARPASVHRVPNPPPWFVTPFDRTNEYSCCSARPARLNMNGYHRFAIVNAFRFPVLPGATSISACWAIWTVSQRAMMIHWGEMMYWPSRKPPFHLGACWVELRVSRRGSRPFARKALSDPCRYTPLTKNLLKYHFH